MKLARGIYWAVGLVNLYAAYASDVTLNHFTKPLLMPILIYLVFLESRGHVTLPRLLLAAGLVFAWIGDLFLMFQGADWYFLAGLGAFLVMQVIYSMVFRKSMDGEPEFSLKRASPLLLLLVVILIFIAPSAGTLQVPVSVYATCILTMLAFAYFRKGLTNILSYREVFIGAVLFVISDAVIAFDKFILEVPLSKVWVMITYIPAQFLIVSGVLKHK